MNNSGSGLITRNLVEEAVKTFELNGSIFLNSPNVYNSLAEGFIAKGDFEFPVLNLKKPIEHNYPDAIFTVC